MKSIIYILTLLCCLLSVSLVAQNQGFRFVSSIDKFSLSVGTLVSGIVTIDPVGEGGKATLSNVDEVGIIPGKEYTISASNGFFNLNIIDNQLTSLDVSELTKLTSLWCDNNLLESLDVSNLKQLIDFTFSGNKISSMNLSGLNKLKDIACFNNDFNVCALDSLFLSLPQAPLSGSDIYIAYNNLENGINNKCRTDIASGKKWRVLELKDSPAQDVLIVNTEFGCESTDIPESISVKIDGKKTLNGKPIQAGQFVFELLKDGETTPLTAKNNANGDFSILIPSLDKVGTHKYTLKEKNLGVANYTYDDKIYNVEVELSLDEATNTLGAKIKIKDGETIIETLPEFVNTFVNTGINKFNFNTGIMVYPNPIHNNLYVESDEIISEISFYDITGKLIFSELVNDNRFVIQTTHFNSGIYVLRVQTASELRNFKISKE